MKKILALLVMLVVSFSVLTGCSDPVYDDLENFLNVEMTEVNANYEEITAEAGRWAELEEDAELEASIGDVLLPLVDDSLERLENITPATDEVKEIKDKYVAVMEAYKEGFTGILAGIQAVDEDLMTEGSAKVEEGVELLDEYNAALEALAEDAGSEIVY